MSKSGPRKERRPLETLCVLLVAGTLMGFFLHWYRGGGREAQVGKATEKETPLQGEGEEERMQVSGTASESGGRRAMSTVFANDRESTVGYQPPRIQATEPVRESRGRIPAVTDSVDGEFRALDVVTRYLLSGEGASPIAGGWTRDDVSNPKVLSQTLSRKSGVTAVHLKQRVGDLEIHNAYLNANVAKDGSILSLHNGFVRDAKFLISSSQPEIEAAGAVKEAARHAMVAFPGERELSVLSEKGGAAQETEFEGSGLSQDPIPVRLVYYATSEQEIRLAWNLVLHLKDGQRWLDMNIDAENGSLLSQANWYASADYRVFASPLENPNAGVRTVESDPQDSMASPFGWHDTDGILGAEYTDTRGNNVEAQEDGDKSNDGGLRPDGSAGLDFDFPIDFGQDPDTYQEASITNLFYWNNVIHDVMWHHGFDELAGNFQANNYGNGGVEGDPVQADAQDGLGVNNANFGTPPDGSVPRMQMYVWTQANPDRDSSLDSGIVVHEYGHGVSNRLTGGPANSSALSQLQSKGMGEGWSDWFALVMTASASDTSTTSRGIGTYVTNQPDTTSRGIRSYPYSTDLSANPLTFGDVADSDLSLPHGIGTVWCSALWEMYWSLVAEYGWDPDLYYGSGGNNLALDLVIEGMKMQPANPTYMEARDAILLADQVLNDGDDIDLIWLAFAKRGMGFSADDGGTSSTRNVVEAYDVPNEGISVTDVSVAEGNSGSKVATFTVSLDLPAEDVITVDWATQDGSASSSGDFIESSGQITFGVGESEKTVDVSITGDVTPEDDETFLLILSNPVEAYLADDVGVCTIENDDYLTPVINSSLTSGGNIGNDFSYTITAANTPRTFSLSGEPAGMTVNASTGEISWIPDAVGVVNVQIIASNPAGMDTETLVIDIEENVLLSAIDSGSLPVSTSAVPWFSQTTTTHDGSDAAQAGSVADGQASSLDLEIEGPQEIVFWWKVSSEYGNDELKFEVDGETVERISGEVDWTQVFRSLPEGTHTLRWEYEKDDSASSGADTGWLDEFTILVSDDRPFVTSSPTTYGFLGDPFSYQVTTSKPADSFSSTALPVGLTLNTSTGLISGTPTEIGSTDVVVTANNAAGSTQRTITIAVLELAPIPFSDSFESGSLSSYWLATGKGAPRTEVTQDHGPADGDWHVTMDSATSGIFSRNALTLTIDVSGYDLLELRFLARKYGDEPNAPPPSPFPGNTGFDGVSISPDGVNWYEVQALREEVTSVYQEFSVNLLSAISTHGLSTSGIYQIRFNQYDDRSIDLSDGIGIDNVRIETVPHISAPDLSSSSDLGESDTDDFTADTTPTLTGIGTPGLSLELISDVEGTVATGIIGDSGRWSVTTAELSNGVHQFTAVADGGVVSDTLDVEIETAQLDVTLEQASGQADPTTGGPVLFDVEFSRDVVDFGPEDVTATGGGVGNVYVTGSGTNYQIQVTTDGKDGHVDVDIAEGAVYDSPGNGNTPVVSVDHSVLVDGHGGYSSPTPVDVSGGTGSQSGWIEGSDTDAFAFTVPRDCIARIYTTGDLDTIGELRDDSGDELNDPEKDDDRGVGKNFRIVEDLEPGDYVTVVGSRDGGKSYDLVIEILEDVYAQPDIWMEGLGNDVYDELDEQTLTRISRKGGRVTSSVSVENDGSLSDTVTVSGSNGSSLIRVYYYSSEDGNITSQVVAGKFDLYDFGPTDDRYRILVQFAPKKSKLRRKLVRKKDGRIRYRTKRYTFSFRADSELDGGARDRGAIRLKAKWK